MIFISFLTVGNVVALATATSTACPPSFTIGCRHFPCHCKRSQREDGRTAECSAEVMNTRTAYSIFM